jgi:5'-3' exonuclease
MRSHLCELEPENRNVLEMEALRHLLKQNLPVNPKEDLPYLRQFLVEVGVPCLDAPDEAEKFCAYLAAKGIASASWTTDTDSYAFGAPMFITGYDPVPRGEDPDRRPPSRTWYRATHFSVIMPPVALADLGMTRAQFADLCIMFGCDFNTRMEGVGPVRASKMLESALQKAPSASRLIEIAAVDAPDLPWHLLNAERCRSIFLDDAQCAAALEATEPRCFDLDEGRAASEFGGQYDEWRRICGASGAKGVQIRSGPKFSRLT